MKALYVFDADCGRMGNLYGMFIAEKGDVAEMIDSGVEIRFGEVLGKHSNISGEMTYEHITMISDDQEFVKQCEQLHVEVGFDPVSIWREQKEEDM